MVVTKTKMATSAATVPWAEVADDEVPAAVDGVAAGGVARWAVWMDPTSNTTATVNDDRDTGKRFRFPPPTHHHYTSNGFLSLILIVPC